MSKTFKDSESYKKYLNCKASVILLMSSIPDLKLKRENMVGKGDRFK